jgi:hypothetical protein
MIFFSWDYKVLEGTSIYQRSILFENISNSERQVRVLDMVGCNSR